MIPNEAPPNLAIVVPCFNEEEALLTTNARLVSLLSVMCDRNLISGQSTVFYVDDGSHDRTWALIEHLSGESAHVSGIRLSRNQGHQNALVCGLLTAKGDVFISIDADLQDNPEVMCEMLEHYKKGFEIVYGVRKRRDSDSFFKRVSAGAFYKLMATVGVDIIYNHADYRLLGSRAVNALSQYREVNLFLRGVVRLIGFPTQIVEYDRNRRIAGESKYPLRRMLSFAWQGITSFSTAPLRLITATGALVSLFSITLSLWALFVALLTEKALPGWASTVIPMYFLGGVQLMSLGIIGEYVAKIYMETKCRPRYHVEEVIGKAFEKSPEEKI